MKKFSRALRPLAFVLAVSPLAACLYAPPPPPPPVYGYAAPPGYAYAAPPAYYYGPPVVGSVNLGFGFGGGGGGRRWR